VFAIAKLGINLIAGIAGAPTVFLARIFGERIAALNHEALHNAMKTGAVIKGVIRQLLEILNRLGRNIRPELNHHLAPGGANHGNFLVRFAHRRQPAADSPVCHAKRKNSPRPLNPL